MESLDLIVITMGDELRFARDSRLPDEDGLLKVAAHGRRMVTHDPYRELEDYSRDLETRGADAYGEVMGHLESRASLGRVLNNLAVKYIEERRFGEVPQLLDDAYHQLARVTNVNYQFGLPNGITQLAATQYNAGVFLLLMDQREAAKESCQGASTVLDLQEEPYRDNDSYRLILSALDHLRVACRLPSRV